MYLWYIGLIGQRVCGKYLTAKGVRSPKSLGTAALDRQALASSLSAVPGFSDPSSIGEQSKDDLIDSYNQSITDIIDILLPVRPARLRSHPLSPWFDGECHSLRRQARRLERVFQRTCLPDDRASWILFVRSMHRRYREKEGEYWEHKISSSEGALDHFQGSPW